MKKVLTTATALLFGVSIAMAQNPAPAAPSPHTSYHGNAWDCDGRTSRWSLVRRWTSRVNRSSRASVPPVTRSAPTDSIRRRKAKTRRLTKRCCVSLGSRRIRSGSFMSAAKHANLQYRIDDVLIPESIPGFGQVLETRFADNISLITGALPAQFGFRNTGVIDIHTKNGAVFQQGDASVYGGSFDNIMPSF